MQKLTGNSTISEMFTQSQSVHLEQYCITLALLKYAHQNNSKL